MIFKLFLLIFFLLGFFSSNLSFVKSDSNNDLNFEIQNYLPKYTLGPGDILKIKIFKFENFSAQVKVLPDGTINLPRVNSLYVKNLTLDEANKLITKNYQKIIRNPLVYIDLLQTRPIRIKISGEVQRPGIYSLDTREVNEISNTDGGEQLILNNSGWPTIIDAIQKAGGLTNEADLRKIILKRQNKETGNLDEIVINIWDNLLSGSLIRNHEIFDDDTIFVGNSNISTQKEKTFISSTNLSPSTISVRVIGEVINPGSTNVRSNSPIMEGILNAGGFTNRANRKKLTLLRLNNDGKIEKKTILNHDSAKNNVFLKDRDVIFIDDNSLSKTSNNLKKLVEPIRPIIDAATFYKIFFD